MSTRRGVDGGLPAPKTCRLVPPSQSMSRDWEAFCVKRPCKPSTVKEWIDIAKSREQAIEAHRAHVEQEHGEGR